MNWLKWGVATMALAGLGLVVVWFSVQADSPRAAIPVGPSSHPLAEIPDATAASRRKSVELQYERLDAGTDGWETEVASEAASLLLEQVGNLLANPQQIDAQHLSTLAVPNCSCQPLRPSNLETVFSDQFVSVQRSTAGNTTARLSLADALSALCEPFDGAADVRVKFKVFRIALQDTRVETSAYYEAAGRFQKGAVQQSAVWHCGWDRRGSQLLLQSIQVEDFQEVTNLAGRNRWLADCTEAVLGANRCYQAQFLYGVDYWHGRIDRSLGTDSRGHQGLAVGDVNSDGLEDVYICQTGGLPNRLFVQRADGTAEDVSAESGTDFLEDAKCALLVDLDNDGDQDLVVGLQWGLAFMANDGQGRFTLKDRFPYQSQPYSLAAADYDNDGDLDVYVCAYSFGYTTQGMTSPVPFHDANNGGRNLLLVNNGDWHFINGAEQAGLNQNNTRFSFAAAWEDYDNDGDPDLYVANDFGRNNLYRNDRGRFVDVAAEAGVEDVAAGMSVSWGDYNNDGWMDIYVGNMFSSAGNRIAFQRNFQPASDETVRRQFQRHARGNTLFENAADGTFRDVSAPAGVTMGRWAWASTFVDLNNDGWEDIYITNGMLTRDSKHDL